MTRIKRASLANDLTDGPVPRTLISFALPMILSNLLQTVYSMVDMVVIGQFVGSVGLSAVSIGADIALLPAAIAIGFANAGQIIISQFVGAGDKKSVTRTIGTLFTTVLLASVLFTAICFTFNDSLLALMNTPGEAYKLASRYCMTCYSGFFFTFGYTLVSAILRGMGDSRHPLMFIAIAAVSNLVLDLIFVAVFKWSTFGAALATVIAQAISFVTAITFLYRRRESFGFDFKREGFKPDRFIFGRLVRLGVPMSFQVAAILASMMVVNAYVNVYGVVASAVNGVGNKLTHVTTIVSSSLTTTGATMIGQTLGAGKVERVPRIFNFSLLLSLTFGLLLSIATVIFPREIFGLFNSDSDVLDMAVIYIPYAVMGYLGYGVRTPFFSLIYGLGFAKMNMIIGLVDGVLCRIGLAMLFGITAGMGIRGFWLGNGLAGFVPVLIIGTYYVSGRWKTRKLFTAA